MTGQDNSSSPHTRFSRRLEGLTLILGLTSAVVVSYWKSPRVGMGVAIGALLAWLNYRWMDKGLGAFVKFAQDQASSAHPKVPPGIYWRFAGRYGLIGLAVYVSVKCFAVPVLAIVAGLLALGAAAMAEGLYEVVSGAE